MKSIVVAASLGALVAGANSAPAAAQSAATEQVGPPSSAGQAVRAGPLPARLSLAQAMEEADARSPRVVAAEAEVAAARGRPRQAGYRFHPILHVYVENFAGTGPYSGLTGPDTTVRKLS